MSAWPAKDPDAVLDYTFTIPLDAGDAVDTYTFTRVSGTVVIEDEDIAGAVITARLSGGVDGETSVFQVTWVTTADREDEEFITQLVTQSDYVALVYTDYVKPRAQHLIARYPAFADVDTTTIQYWLTDAERFVDESWSEGDYAIALMALAAHNMATAGLGTDAAAVSDIPTGVTSIKTGSFSASFADGVAADRVTGALASTRYGAEYAALLRRNKGGPRITATGALPYSPLHYVDGGA